MAKVNGWVRHCVVATVLWGALSGIAFADSVRVVADRSTIWRTATGIGGVLDVVRAGAVLEVLGRQGRWLIVVPPGNPHEMGYILASQTTAADAASEPTQAPSEAGARRGAGAAQTPRPTPRPAVRPSGSRRSTRGGYLYGGVTVQASSLAFRVSDTATTFLEPETRTTSYGALRAPGFEIAAGMTEHRVWAIGATLVRQVNSEKAAVSAQIPHPLYYNQPRALAGNVPSDRTDLAVHAQISFLAVDSRHLRLRIGGGPSLFHVSTELLDQISYNETYPYDTVQFTSATMRRATATGYGGHGQIDVMIPITPSVSWQTSGRWSRGSVKLDGVSEQVPVGLGQVTSGLRVGF